MNKSIHKKLSLEKKKKLKMKIIERFSESLRLALQILNFSSLNNRFTI